MLKKLIAMQMENQAANESNDAENKEDINEMMADSQESSNHDDIGMDGRPRVVMKKF